MAFSLGDTSEENDVKLKRTFNNVAGKEVKLVPYIDGVQDGDPIIIKPMQKLKDTKYGQIKIVAKLESWETNVFPPDVQE